MHYDYNSSFYDEMKFCMGGIDGGGGVDEKKIRLLAARGGY